MKKILIIRRYFPKATYSEWLMDGYRCWGVEREWAGNAPFESCIPEGQYMAHRILHSSKTRGRDTFELRVSGRIDIQIHHANYANELSGCLAPGGEPCCVEGKIGVPNSFATFKRVMEVMEGEDEIIVDIRKH